LYQEKSGNPARLSVPLYLLFISEMVSEVQMSTKRIAGIPPSFLQVGNNGARLYSFDSRPTIAGLPDISGHNVPKWGKMYQMTSKFTKGHIYEPNDTKYVQQMAIKY
jgi:hypothetical protein